MTADLDTRNVSLIIECNFVDAVPQLLAHDVVDNGVSTSFT